MLINEAWAPQSCTDDIIDCVHAGSTHAAHTRHPLTAPCRPPTAQTELDRTCNAAAALQRSLTRSEEDAAAAHVTAQRLEAELEALKE